MRFMVIVPAGAESETGALPDEKILEEMGRFNEEMANAGVMLAGEGLHPSSKGARIRYEDGKTTVTRGPFDPSRGMVAGFWLIQTKSMDEAIEWMKRAPFGGGVELEIRQVFETEEFAESDPTGKLRESETRLRDRAAENARRAAA